MRRILDKIFLSLFLLIGLGAMGMGIFLMARMLSFVANATRTEGTVVALESHISTTGGTPRRLRRRTSQTWQPVFEFKDLQGSMHRVTEPFGSRPAMFKKGETVSVLYDSSNPERAHINATKILWFGPGLVTVAGLVFSVAGCFLWRRETRRTQGFGPGA